MSLPVTRFCKKHPVPDAALIKIYFGWVPLITGLILCGSKCFDLLVFHRTKLFFFTCSFDFIGNNIKNLQSKFITNLMYRTCNRNSNQLSSFFIPHSTSPLSHLKPVLVAKQKIFFSHRIHDPCILRLHFIPGIAQTFAWIL